MLHQLKDLLGSITSNSPKEEIRKVDPYRMAEFLKIATLHMSCIVKDEGHNLCTEGIHHFSKVYQVRVADSSWAVIETWLLQSALQASVKTAIAELESNGYIDNNRGNPNSDPQGDYNFTSPTPKIKI